ncbi:MAG: cytochrome P450 [Myxococcota bacterium]
MSWARGLWLRDLDTPAAAQAVWRHPSFRDRAPLEVAMSRYFFAPFDHQEVCVGDRFARRAAWSRAALGRMPIDAVAEAAARHTEAWLDQLPATVPSLLAAVRRLTLPLMCELTLGHDAGAEVAPVAARAVADIDASIKLMARPHLAVRRALGSRLDTILRGDLPAPSLVAAARAAGADLPRSEAVHQVAASMLATGTIQLTDVVTHALIARAQHPDQVAAASVAAWVAETVRCFPVNASVTRINDGGPVRVAGLHFPAGTAVSASPRRLNRRLHHRLDAFRAASDDAAPDPAFAFGWGPRACPAQRFGLVALTAMLRRLRARLEVRIPTGTAHRRSLALPVPASLGRRGPGATPLPEPPSPPAWRPRIRYAATCAYAYPAAFFTALSARSPGLQGPSCRSDL